MAQIAAGLRDALRLPWAGALWPRHPSLSPSYCWCCCWLRCCQRARGTTSCRKAEDEPPSSVPVTQCLLAVGEAAVGDADVRGQRLALPSHILQWLSPTPEPGTWQGVGIKSTRFLARHILPAAGLWHIGMWGLLLSSSSLGQT